MTWARGRCPYPTPYHLWLVGDLTPRSSVGDLCLPLTYCNTWEHRPAPDLGSTVELALNVGVAGKPDLRVRVWENWPRLLSVTCWLEQAREGSLPLLFGELALAGS